MARIAVACGPTGGHLIPALTVLEQFSRAGYDTHLYTRENSFLSYFQDYDFRSFFMESRSLVGKNHLRKIIALLSISADYIKHRDRVSGYDAVIGFGGYSSAPLLLAAWETGVPIYLHEQNRIPGRTTRFFQDKAQAVFYGFPPVKDAHARSIISGTPIRSLEEINDPWISQGKILTVCGGSQGALELSFYLRETAPPLMDRGWKIFYVKGKFGLDLSEKTWAESSSFRQVNFTENLPEVIASSTLVWSRAGAGTLTEIMAYHRPALIFPLKSSADQHQQHNARWVSERGPAYVIEDKTPPQKLVEISEQLAKRDDKYDLLRTKRSSEQFIFDMIESDLGRQ